MDPPPPTAKAGAERGFDPELLDHIEELARARHLNVIPLRLETTEALSPLIADHVWSRPDISVSASMADDLSALAHRP